MSIFIMPNPFYTIEFIQSLKYSTKSFPIADTVIVSNNIEANTSKHITTIKNRKPFINESFVKLFIKNIKQGFEFDISPTGHKLFVILMLSYTNKDNDYVYYKYDDIVCNQTISKGTYYKAVNELIDLKIIAKHELHKFVYYVNPMYFYNGTTYKILEKLKRLNSDS